MQQPAFEYRPLTRTVERHAKGRTYYGCCEGCKKHLETNQEARMDVDPVSGNDVDKALAVIGSLPVGRVYYFASAENLAAFNTASVN